SSPTSTFTGTAGSTYTLRWTISNSPCTASTDDVTITFNRAPTTAAAGPDQTGSSTCGLTQVTLAANAPSVGTGAWSIISGSGGTVTTPSSPTSTFTGTAGSTYTLRWTISNSPCTASTDDVVVTFNQEPTTANAGTDNVSTCGLTTITLAANTPTVGTGAWSITSGTGGSFGNVSSPASTFTGEDNYAYTLRWTISNSPCTASFDEVDVKFNMAAVVTAGPDQTKCAYQGSVDLLQSNIGGSTTTVSWSSSGNGTFADPNALKTFYTFSADDISAGSVTLTLSSDDPAGPCGAATDQMIVTINSCTKTTAKAGAWDASGTWTPSGAPVNTEDVTINHAVIVSDNSSLSPAICRNMTISSGGSVTVNPNQALTVDGTLTNSSASKLVVESGGSLIENYGVAATVKRTIAADEWHLISSPISDATAGIFAGYYLQKHSESDNQYTDITSINEGLIPMRGYALYGDAGLPAATFAGFLNAGAKSFSTTAYTYTSDPVDDGGWNLVGNPYPSSIDWDASSGWTKTGINAAVYCHMDQSNWATWVPGSPGAGTNGGSQYIAPGQGFFVQVTEAGTLVMTDAVRVHNATTFFKNTEIVPNLIRLEVSGNGYKDEAVVRFVPEATAGFDGNYDAHKLFGDVAAAAQISTGSMPLAINSLPETNIVPVGVKIGTSGTYTIAATEINNLEWVALEDTKTGIFTELAKSGYTFNFTTGENEKRFNLHFSALGIADDQPQAADIYSYQKTVYINLNDNGKGDVFIYNISGQLVASIPSARGMNRVDLANMGNYIIKVVTGKATEVRKVFVK
ncbi:MAG: T9SS type A sorting domain-containing protein, partial [Bacteroidales bacterium]